MEISRPRRTLHAKNAHLCRQWMKENAVERADLIPYSATINDVGGEVALGRKIARARESYLLGRLAPESIEQYEDLPGWSWVATRIPHGAKPSIANVLADRARIWLRANRSARADTIPNSAELELEDGQTYKLGEALRNMRRRYSQGKLTRPEIQALEKLPHWTWTPPRQRPVGARRNSIPK